MSIEITKVDCNNGCQYPSGLTIYTIKQDAPMVPICVNSKSEDIKENDVVYIRMKLFEKQIIFDSVCSRLTRSV